MKWSNWRPRLSSMAKRGLYLAEDDSETDEPTPQLLNV
jgi:hypothetical protein